MRRHAITAGPRLQANPEGANMTHDELRKLEAAMEDNDDTVCCDIQMPVAQGRELLELVRAL